MSTLDLFDYTPPETSIFEREVRPLFEEHRATWLERARQAAFELGSDGREVTIDDVRERVPPPSDVDGRVMGAVLTPKHWEAVGYRRSSRRVCHNRPVTVFRLKRARA